VKDRQNNMPKTPQLVSQHLENIGGDVFEEYQEIIREYVSHRRGIYALYKNDRLYYVGLATNLSSRLKAHLGDKHSGRWNRFSVYLTIGDTHLNELESLLLRVVKPKGNVQRGKISSSENLLRSFKRRIKAHYSAKLNALIGNVAKRPSLVPAHKGDDLNVPLAAYIRKPISLRAKLKGKTLRAKVRRDGTIRFQGKVYRSPSAAACAVCKSACNGWRFWKYERAPGDWVRLDVLRK
jgi:hypothetical protein